MCRHSVQSGTDLPERASVARLPAIVAMATEKPGTARHVSRSELETSMTSHPFAESFDLEAAFAGVSDYWSPKVVAQVNDQYVKIAKVRGELVWHDHEHEDELFYIVRGHRPALG